MGAAQAAPLPGASEANHGRKFASSLEQGVVGAVEHPDLSAVQNQSDEDTPQDTIEELVSGDVSVGTSKKPRLAAPPLFQIVGLKPTEEEERRGTELIAAIAEKAPGQYKHASALPPAWRLALSRQRQLRKLEEQQQEEESDEAEEEAEDESADEEEQRASISLSSRAGEDEQEAANERVVFSRLLQLVVRPENKEEEGGTASAAASSTLSPAVLGSRLLTALLQWELGRSPMVQAEHQSSPGAGLIEVVTELQRVPQHVLKVAAGNLVACGAINPPGSVRHPLHISPGLRNMLLVRCGDSLLLEEVI